jgi:hypothetical protein
MISPQFANPFVQLISPEVVIRAVEASERLRGLRRHVCRPLDRVVPVGGPGSEAAEFDAMIDRQGDVDDLR